MLHSPLTAENKPADRLTYVQHIFTGFLPKLLSLQLKFFFLVFSGFSGLFPFQFPRRHTVDKTRSQTPSFLSSFLSQNRYCLSAGHRWSKSFKIHAGKLPKIKCGYQKLYRLALSVSYATIRRRNSYHGYGVGPTTMNSAHFTS